jgi:hypothetical protein
MRAETFLAAALLIALAGCAGPPEEPADPVAPGILQGQLEARATAKGLELTNHGTSPVYYRARDPLSLALSDRIPCLKRENCPSVPAQGRVTVPFEEAIVGYRPDTRRAEVYWWHFVAQPGGSYGADLVRTLEVVC